MSNHFEPTIIGFLCNWCSYAGGDLAGVSRLEYPSNMKPVRVMCTGMVHPDLVEPLALASGEAEMVMAAADALDAELYVTERTIHRE